MRDPSALGFGPFFERQLTPAQREGPLPARVAAEHRGAYEVWSAQGAGRARLAGRLRAQLTGAEVGAPGVGDWVVLRDLPGPGHPTVIERVLARRTVFTRGAAGREARAQVVAANVDRVLVVVGLDGDFNVHRIERALARIWAGGAEPVVVLNKVDLCADPFARRAAVLRRAPSVPVHLVSARQGEGLEAVRAEIPPGQTVALVGSSGAGKSTLVNALVGEAQMRTGAVRSGDDRGRHVTTHRQLVRLPGGGVLLDTPGMRELQLLDAGGLGTVFADLVALAEACRFRDCRHDTEPGCAVRAALASGALDADRLAHYRKLEAEAAATARRLDVHLRRQAGRDWGQRVKEAARLRRWKGRGP